MKILLCSGGGEPPYSTNRSMFRALQRLGHEVTFVGPGYYGRSVADIPVEDRNHPERYSYNEVLELYGQQPDLILQIEPHFYLTGRKPPEIKAVHYFTDPHRAGKLLYGMSREGQFDVVLSGQEYYLPLFEDLPSRVAFLPVGFDSERFASTQKWTENTSRCDISFIGQSGIAGMEFPYKDEIGVYTTRPPQYLPPDMKRYTFHQSPGFDYAERAEMLIHLCRDFNVRIYGSLYGDKEYVHALRTGTMVFHRSLLQDVSIRIWEVLAAGKMLIADYVPCLEHLIQDGAHYRSYFSFYRPFFENFALEYRQVYKLVKYYLDHDNEREYIAKIGHDYAWSHGTWEQRAIQLINFL